MRYPSRPDGAFLLCIGLLVLAPTPVDGQTDAGTAEAVPAGMVAHFAAQAGCPAGWMPATSVQGRMIVGTNTVGEVGTTVGSSLSNLEDRSHTHGFTASLNIPPQNIAGSDGGNNQGAQSGNQVVSGTSGAATTGLPYAQLLPCVRP